MSWKADREVRASREADREVQASREARREGLCELEGKEGGVGELGGVGASELEGRERASMKRWLGGARKVMLGMRVKAGGGKSCQGDVYRQRTGKGSGGG